MGTRTLRASLSTLACLGMLAAPLWAADPGIVLQSVKTSKPLALDVKLDSQRGLSGEVRDTQGKLQARANVQLWQRKQLLQRVQADATGKFRFADVRGGFYRIQTAQSGVACRAWTAVAAPPAARESLLVVTNIYSARGQQPINEVFCYNPFVMGTIIAAAIAIPIAVHNSDDDDAADGS